MWYDRDKTLQTLSLCAIAKNFDRYFVAYSNDVKVQKRFQVIQKVYSHEMADELNTRIEEKHADLVFNKYLQNLKGNWFKNFSWEAVVSKMAEIGPGIKKIYICRESSHRSWDLIFPFLPNLEILHFHNRCTDEDLKSVAEHCPNIEKMEIFEEQVTDKGWKSLCRKKNGRVPCTKLWSIVVEWECSRITDAASIYLVRNLPSLEYFTCYNLSDLLYEMHRIDLPRIDKLKPYNLTYLDLTAYIPARYDDLLKVCFTLCPNLKTLAFPVTKPQQLNWIEGLSTLERILIDNRYKGDFLDVNHFLKLRGQKLTQLQLRNCFVSLKVLSENCPLLNKLLLDYVRVEDEEETSIPPMENLETFELSVGEENVQSASFLLIPMPKLYNMTCIKCDLTPTEIKAAVLKCCEQNRVRTIHFGSSVVEKRFMLDIISTCRSLLYFDVDMYCGVNGNDKKEIIKYAKTQPNKPNVPFGSGELVSNYKRFSY